MSIGITVFPLDAENPQEMVQNADICSAIIARAKCLNLVVIAEGVEYTEQYEFLRQKGCDVIQVFHFHKPMPLAEVETMLDKI